MSKPLLKVGIIGCGSITQTAHLPSWLKCKKAKVAAVCDINEELARQVASAYKIENYYSGLDQMLAAEKLDIVDICTATPTHASLAIQAMEAGCHSLTEKPMALNVNEANKMIKTAKRMNVKLCVSHDMLFSLTISRMRRIIEQGKIGKILRTEIKQYRPKNDPVFRNKAHWMHSLPGGIVIGDDLIHPLYITRAFLGNIEAVAAFPRKIGNVEHVPLDEIQVVLKGERGWGNIVTSYNTPQNGMIVDIWGTEKHLHGELFNCILYKSDGPGINAWSRTWGNMSRILQIIGNTTYAGSKAIFGAHGGHKYIVNEFVESILNNSYPPITAVDGQKVVEIVEKVTRMVIAKQSQ